MSVIRVVWGSAAGPTKLASYDAALADAGIENYNLVTVSSVIPADVPVETVVTAPDLGPAGNRLTVVEARATTAGPGRVSAGLAWSRSVGEGPGLFYEAAGETDPETVERRLRNGLEHGRSLRPWEFGDVHVRVESETADPDGYTTVLVAAVYGRGEPILRSDRCEPSRHRPRDEV